MHARLMPGRWKAAAGYSCLTVALYAAESAQALPTDRGDSPPDHVPTLTVLR